MNRRIKRYSIPAYKESKGMRGEVIRKVVNFLGKTAENNQECAVAIITAHDTVTSERSNDGVALNINRYSPETDKMFSICSEEIYRQVEEWAPRRLDNKFLKVRILGSDAPPRYFHRTAEKV